MAWAVALTTGLVAYNNLLNRWPPFQRAAYLPLNLALAAGLVLVGLGPLGLDAEALGLPGDRAAALRGVALGAGAGTLLTLPLFVAAAVASWAPRVADRRVAGLGGGRLAYQLLVRIPVGTALVEEVAFRGVLLAAWRPLGPLAAAVASSAAFGLWHVAPTLNLVRANRPEARPGTAILATLGAVAFTTAAGLVLCWLRLRSGGLAAPVGLHATVNGLGALAAVLAARRSAAA